jgi:hypothetical protein
MSTNSSDELSSFQHFLTERIASGDAELSPEQALDEWRTAHPCEDDFADTVRALRTALSEMEAGDRGMPFSEFDADFRARHGIEGGA